MMEEVTAAEAGSALAEDSDGGVEAGHPLVKGNLFHLSRQLLRRDVLRPNRKCVPEGGQNKLGVFRRTPPGNDNFSLITVFAEEDL